MPKYPCYVVIVGREPGVYEVWSDVAATVYGVPHANYHGCTSLPEALRIYKDHQRRGNVRAVRPAPLAPSDEWKQTGVPMFASPARDQNGNHTQNHAQNREQNQSGNGNGNGDWSGGSRTMISDPDTSPRGGSLARGRARAASPAPPSDRTARPLQPHPHSQPVQGVVRSSAGGAAAKVKTEPATVEVRRSQRLATPARRARAPPASDSSSSSSDEDEDEDEDESPYGSQTTTSSLTTSVELDGSGNSEPEAVSSVSITASPRLTSRTKKPAALTRYHTPPSTIQLTPSPRRSRRLALSRASSTDTDSSVQEDSRGSPPTLQTQYYSEGRSFTSASPSSRTAKSKSKLSDVDAPGPDESISSIFRERQSNHSGAVSRPRVKRLESVDVVPTRPNTPQGNRKTRSRAMVISLQVCNGCAQPLPDPPLAPPPPVVLSSNRASGESDGSLERRRVVKFCAACYQPILRTTPSSSSSASSKRSTIIAGALQGQVVKAGPSEDNALGLIGTSASGRRVLKTSVRDPRSPLARSETVSDLYVAKSH
ncbi:hypothetical protein BDW22DRAFT_1360788 [Trametopsis cervina]|nr:hypothetical protein BDW22DRAFT_1360788 [Trametopsis cervina]